MVNPKAKYICFGNYWAVNNSRVIIRLRMSALAFLIALRHAINFIKVIKDLCNCQLEMLNGGKDTGNSDVKTEGIFFPFLSATEIADVVLLLYIN
jgi:hypothetical protein